MYRHLDRKTFVQQFQTGDHFAAFRFRLAGRSVWRGRGPAAPRDKDVSLSRRCFGQENQKGE
jgi:hypothetical protein